MSELEAVLFRRCRDAAKRQMNFRPDQANPNEPQTEEEARQYFRGIYGTILAAGLAEKYSEWKEQDRLGEKVSK